jgi:pyruvate,water dikinase
MIDADVSGVAFTVNPLSGNEEMVINAVFGLGEGLVSGELDADLFTIQQGQIHKQITTKNRALVFDKLTGKGTIYVDLSQEKSNSQSLSDFQIEQLCQVLATIEQNYGCPQDVEFCFADNQLFILQARPITTLSKEPFTIWDNSNIVESYPALTSPLTFSFILKMYEAVYQQLSLIMGIRQQKIEENAEVFQNMLGLLWGRVYYNLNNWHNALALLPGYELNADFMDKMMGVKEKFPTKIAKKTSKFRQLSDIVRAFFSVLKTHRNIEKERKRFLTHFHGVLKEYEQLDFKALSKQELMDRYLEFEHTLSHNWRAPLVNDFFCMIYFGVLQKLCANWCGDENGEMHNNLLIGAKDIISTEPVHWTQEIIELILKHPEAKALFQTSNNEEIWSQLQVTEFAEILGKIQLYLEKWGARCVGELKLETVTYDQQPTLFIAILKSYVQNGQAQHLTKKDQHNSLRNDAESLAFSKLRAKTFKKMGFRYVLKKTRYLVSNRENLRFERTKGFGMVRKMMLAFGEKLRNSGALQNERDIFYLTQQEIFDYVKGTAVHVEFTELIETRKATYLKYEKMNLPERIKSRGSVYEGMSLHSDAITVEQEHVLKGIPCCAGVVEGIVSVLHAPHEIDKINGNILVTTSTDPGWVVLFPKATAIVVERGSLLSHSAIVSREMGIPCIVGVKGLLNQVKSGDKIRMNGATGTIEILKRA